MIGFYLADIQWSLYDYVNGVVFKINTYKNSIKQYSSDIWK